MHRIQSISVSETDDGEHSVIITLGGEIDSDMERFLRSEYDKTLVRERRGGVILDLTQIDYIGKRCIIWTLDFMRNLSRDGIKLAIVAADVANDAFAEFGFADKFTIFSELGMAKQALGIAE